MCVIRLDAEEEGPLPGRQPILANRSSCVELSPADRREARPVPENEVLTQPLRPRADIRSRAPGCDPYRPNRQRSGLARLGTPKRPPISRPPRGGRIAHRRSQENPDLAGFWAKPYPQTEFELPRLSCLGLTGSGLDTGFYLDILRQLLAMLGRLIVAASRNEYVGQWI